MPTAILDPVTELILGEEPELRRLASRLTRCAADADDLCQETLLRAYRARERFAMGTSISAWTHTIMRNAFLTEVTAWRHRTTQTGEGADAAIARTPARNDALRSQISAEALDDRVKRALERVPEIHRTPFLLLVVEGLSCREIGRKLGLPDGTVMSRVHRAREQLKRDLVFAGRTV